MIGSKKQRTIVRNSSLREWQQVFLEQEVAFLSGKLKNARGEQKQGKNIEKACKFNN